MRNVATFGSYVRLAGGVVNGVCGLLQVRSFEDIFEPIAMLYGCWAEKFGGAEAQRIAASLHEFAASVPRRDASAPMSLKDYAQSMCAFAHSSESDLMCQAALLVGTDLDSYIVRARTLSTDDTTKLLGRLVSEMLLTTNFYSASHELEVLVKCAIEQVGLQRIIEAEGYGRYERILEVFAAMAEQNGDEGLTAVVTAN